MSYQEYAQLGKNTRRARDAIQAPRPELIDLALSWRPFYLRRKILASFAAIFAGVAVCTGALYDHSHRNTGLGPTDQAGHYLWRFLPTALLITITALWNRVDYQARNTAPWIRLSTGATGAEQTLLLDYVTMYQPWCVVRALRNKDFVVACTATVASILRILVVISTGLISLTLISLPSQNITVMLETAFSDNATGLADAGALAFFTMVGVQQDNVSYPDGVSARYTYQQFSSELTRGSIINTTVDGFSARLECETARLELDNLQYNNSLLQFSTVLSAGECNTTVLVSSKDLSTSAETNSSRPFQFARFEQGSCGDFSSLDDQRIVVMFGAGLVDSPLLLANSSTGIDVVNGTITKSMQLLCKPAYTISRVDIAKVDSKLLTISLSANPQNRTINGVQPWDLAKALFGSYTSELASTYADTTPWFQQPEVLNVDPAMYMALDLRFRTSGKPVVSASLLDATTLEGIANEYFQQYSALIASRSLMHKTASPIDATASTTSERLLASFLITKLLVILLAISTALVVTAALLVPRNGILPRDPGTIINMAALVSNSRDLLQALRGAGGGDMATLRARLAGSRYYSGIEAYERSASTVSGYFKIFGPKLSHEVTRDYIEPTEKFSYPDLLHPLQRLTAFMFIIGLIIGLDISLQSSTRIGGLGDAEDDTYLHLLWTVIPTLVVSLATIYFVSADFNIRLLAPYAALRRGASLEQSMGLNLVDKLNPVVIYHAIKSRNLAVGAASVAAFLSSMLAIFSASLFAAATVPVTASCQVLARDFFFRSSVPPNPSVCTTCQNGTLLSSLILDGNVSFPPFTHEDLAFPTLSLENVPDDVEVPDDLTVTATIPAVRALMACRIFRQSEILISLTTSSTSDGYVNPLRINLPGETEVDGSTIIISTGQTPETSGSLTGTQIDRDAVFGAGVYSPILVNNNLTSHWIWVWGQLQDANTTQTRVRSISALACNETAEQVNVAASFVGSTLSINPTVPPIPDDSTAIPFPMAVDGTNLNYSNLISIKTNNLVDPFFASLTTSRFAIPASSLGSTDAATVQSVADAITRQHKLMRAQVVSTWNRLPLPADSAAVKFPATLTVYNLDSGAQRRIVQDLASTRVLQALLAAVLIAGTASWLALPKPNTIIPRSPTSIASVVGLLVDGNVFGMLGRGAEWLDDQELRGFFRDGLHVTMGFQLGWEKMRKGRRGRRGREEEEEGATPVVWNADGELGTPRDQVFAVGAIRTGGWGGGENVGLGLQARVGYAHRDHVRDWGWRT
ncbi:hypothetical protein B0T17DRAFT_608822 [Bombardia bombarda]|uniref:Uncharacterized protein n=1 Tax=Bombardia bombarda TaxID=252184 RepID=A0AA40C1L9_9PEZI|nr:hypothetical protein B0T17DRAFT_608822 [Bombardia bombarda]